ncbi:MAG: PAS domain S-box protein [Gammaproteobacteria bacterium]|nr:PAS domain S-box protein [Gammaproteobacteria bacterium]
MDHINSRIFSSGPVAVFRWRASNNCPIISVTQNIHKILGYSAEELISDNHHYGEFIHADDKEKVYTQVNENLNNNIDEFDRLDYRLIKKNGEIVWVQDHTVVIRDDSGEPDYFLGYIIDVTDRHLAVTESVENRNKFEAITNLMTDWAWEVDQNGIYTYCSERVEKFLGYSANEIIGKTPFELMPEEEAKKIADLFIEIVKERSPIRNLENWNLHKNGDQVCLLTNGIPLFSDTGEFVGYCGVDTDITERINNEKKLRRAHAAATEALDVKNQFLANISHELRTPLNGISGAIQLLHDFDASPEQLQYLDIANNSTERLIGLINNLLNYSSITSGKISVNPKPLDIKKLVNNFYNSKKLLSINSEVKLSLNISDNVHDEITTDPVWLNQILDNLFSNAIKFTPSGSINIDVNMLDNNNVSIEILDTGIGIPKAEMSKIFEPFYQIESGVTRKFDGAGLGLSITKDIVNHLGGNLFIESQPKRGTKAWFTIKT